MTMILSSTGVWLQDLRIGMLYIDGKLLFYAFERCLYGLVAPPVELANQVRVEQTITDSTN